jgi:hypothetical protein
MLDFYPIEYYPCPEGEPVLVHLTDDRVAFAVNESDAYDSCWLIQLPFKQPQGAHAGMIKDWAPMPANKYYQQLLNPRYGD